LRTVVVPPRRFPPPWTIDEIAEFLGQSVNRSPIAATGTALPSHRVEAQFLLVSRLSAQAVYQQIVPQDLVSERAKFLDIPIGAQIPALGPVGLSRA